MGILYTITSYFKPQALSSINETSIKLKSQKLKIVIKNKQYKLQQ